LAQNTPLTSVTVLGNKVGITYGAKLSAADQLTASNAIAAAAGLINKNASSLTADQTKAIGQISSFAVSGPNTLLGATGKGSMTLSIGYIHDSSAAWLGSLLATKGSTTSARESIPVRTYGEMSSLQGGHSSASGTRLVSATLRGAILSNGSMTGIERPCSNTWSKDTVSDEREPPCLCFRSFSGFTR